MAKTFNCKNCNEVPCFTIVSFDKAGNHGDFRRCNLCNDIRPMVRRNSEKRNARNARFEALIAELDANFL